MKLVTWNVNSVRARMERLLPWVEEQRPDVLMLQETKCLDEKFPLEPFEELGYDAALHGQRTYNGVAILARGGLEDVTRGFASGPQDDEARVVTARLGGLGLCCVYVVNGREVGHEKYEHKLAWMGRLQEHLAASFSAGEAVVVGGDFNVTFDDLDVHDPEAWRGRILCSDAEREALAQLLEPGYRDAVRAFHPEGGPWTWWDFRTRAFRRDRGLRIDHFLVTEPVMELARSAWVDREARDGTKPSDHAPVVLELERAP